MKAPECYVTRILTVLSLYNPESRKVIVFSLTLSHKKSLLSHEVGRGLLKKLRALFYPVGRVAQSV